MASTPPDPPAIFSKLLVYLAWLSVMLILTWLFDLLMNQQDNPNQQIENIFDSQGTHIVQLKRNRQGHYVVNGFINKHPVIFFLDTGATYVSIPLSLAKILTLKKGPEIVLNTANGESKGYLAILDQVSLGHIQQVNVRAIITPGIKDNIILLGMSFLKNLELIQKGNTLTLKQIY